MVMRDYLFMAILVCALVILDWGVRHTWRHH